MEKSEKKSQKMYDRRKFIQKFGSSCVLLLAPTSILAKEGRKKNGHYVYSNGSDPSEHYYGMGIDINKCIGCGRCANACKIENDVPREPFFFRTWVERYQIMEDGQVKIDSPNGAVDGFKPEQSDTRSVIFLCPKYVTIVQIRLVFRFAR